MAEPTAGLLTPPPGGGALPADPAMAGGAPPTDPAMAGGDPAAAPPTVEGTPTAGAPPQQEPGIPQGVESSLDQRDYELDPPNEKDEASVQRTTMNAIRIIHDKKARESVMGTIATATHPIQGIANAAVQVLRTVEAKEKSEGHEMNDFIRLSSGLAIVQELMTVSEASGITEKFTEDEKKIALAQTVQDWTKEEISSGRRDPSDLQAQTRLASEKYIAQNPQDPNAPEGVPKAQNDPFDPAQTMSEKLNGGGP